MNELAVRNRQRRYGVQSRRLRQIAEQVLSELHGSDYALGIHLVGEEEIARLNERFLKHAGPTDVIAFDHSSDATQDRLYGELFLCVPVAVAQSRRYRIHWPVELVRYLVHGVLHLKGYDDHDPRARRSPPRAPIQGGGAVHRCTTTTRSSQRSCRGRFDGCQVSLQNLTPCRSRG